MADSCGGTRAKLKFSQVLLSRVPGRRTHYMRHILALPLLVLAAFAAYGQSSSSATQQIYSAVDQFSPHKNPNGVWSYGYAPSLGSQTTPGGIKNQGQIVGNYGDSAGVFHAFFLDQGKYSTIDFPDAEQDSLAHGINSAGQVAARYFDGPGYNQGYVFFRGDYAPLVFPGAAATSADGINDKGQIVGFYRAFGGGPTHSFIATPSKLEQQ